MYRSKKDVDKHVENLISKLSVKEFKTRAYSVARLYFEVGDFASCQRYVEQYLTQKDNNAAAYKLLGQALQKLGQKEKALEQYKISLDIDPTQTSTILDICELLADDEVVIDPGRAKYWCEKAEATFPRHPVTFRLRERIVAMSNPDPEALVKLLMAEIDVRPKDAVLHCRLLKHYLDTNKIKEAFEHSSKIEFGNPMFTNNYTWYDNVAAIVKNNHLNANDWHYQLLLLTVRERLCVLSLSETPSAISSQKSLVESSELLHAYDQAIEKVAKIGAPTGFGEFHSGLLQHHRGQIVFHTATLLLKKAKKDQLSWRDATRVAAPLMLLAWQTVPLDTNVNWLCHAPERQQTAVRRWYTEGSYRCSQAGHYLLANIQDKSQSFLDRISQICSGTHWRDKLYEKIFNNRDHLAKIKTSYFGSDAFNAPILRLPRRVEVEAYDVDAHREYPNSLHHFVWILLNYKNYAHFRCTLFDMLTPTAGNCGPETLNKFDVLAFLYFATLTARQQKSNEMTFIASDKPSVVPANISDLQCSLSQMKWWDCAYKFSQNELGTELTDIRATLSRGIEVVRCVDNHGLDPELLCLVAQIFSEKAKLSTSVDEKSKLEVRAGLYYSSALPLLEKLKSKIVIKMPDKRLFDYTHKELCSKELISLIEEGKLYVAVNCLNDCEYDKAIELLTNLKSAKAHFHLSQAYKRLAIDEFNADDSKSKFATLIIKAKTFAYKALDSIKDSDLNKDHPLYSEIQQQIEETEKYINKIDPDLSGNNHDVDGKYSSDENISSAGSEYVSLRNNHHMLRNVSSTPKHPGSNSMLTHYRTAADSQMLDNTRADPQFLEKIENQIKHFQKKLSDDFMEQTKSWFEENRRLGNQIMSTIQSDIQNTTDQFKLLKISVDHVKDQINECRNECKDVGELKKQIAELRKEVNKLKKASSEQTIDESDLYNLEDDYRAHESTSSFAAQLPFQASQVMPSFNQRLVPPFPVPPNPYLYNQGLYNLYNQYSQFSQNATIPGAPPLFDPTKFAYPGVYPTPDQMYMDANLANLVTPSMPPAPAAPVAPSVQPTSSVSTATSAASTKSSTVDKEIPRSLPVNVVITSSDPLPKSTTAPAPILSVTIPQKHIKGTPHNYQIPLPPTNESNVGSPPVFSFPTSGKSVFATTASSVVHWNQTSIFKTSLPSYTTSASNSINTSVVSDSINKSVVGGHTTATPNTSLNKSRTLSERSNTSIENYDPCPDFKPIIPLPDEVKVTTGEEDEAVVFSSRAKLYRFVDKQWKERGLGEMKLLKHKMTGKVRVLMRREQIHKICANHIITPEMEIKPMKNETKAYFWVANDFADETVVLEKFCIRFKTAETALQFYETFEKARKEAEYSSSPVKPFGPSTIKEEVHKNETPQKDKGLALTATSIKSTTFSTTQSKTQFGGFTFTSTPTLKPVKDASVADVTEPATSKINIFGNLNFKSTTSTSSPFSSLLGVTPSSLASSPVTSTSSLALKQDTTSKLNTSDTVEEFEPNVDFKPVIPLPALVDLKTGEEDENILFEHRAKLLRFDGNSKEWKERGLGNIKLLVHKDNSQKVRLLMRREQIMKVCCNHAITKEMLFQKMPNMDKAVTWCAKDFSDGELVSETFCLRFKTVQTCDDFIKAIKNVQSKIKDDSKAAKEEQNAAKQNYQVDFGDKFKPKPGSWECAACYTNNLDSFVKCACCEQPRPGSDSNEIKISAPTTTGFGDKFKPKPGSWECSVCLVLNGGSEDYCTACNNPKDSSIPKKETSLLSENAPKFNFGIPQPTINVTQKKEATPVSTTTGILGWGDKFKPKEGSWECKQCFVTNDSSSDKCSACTGPRDGDTAKNQSGTFVNVSSTPSGPKFTFGIPPAGNVVQPKPEQQPTNSIFDGTGAHKFVFGIPADNQQQPPPATSLFAQQKSIFGNSVSSTGNDGPMNLTANKNEENPSTPSKPALLPTPNIEKTTFGDKDTHATFDFVFKPKTPPKSKSPAKSTKVDGYESDGNEYASDDEGHHIHFSPIIPLPDKVDVVTGEENESELYGHRAKLFRFTSGEWKERGIGIVKILKHKETGKLRVVMRREQIFKICLNHALTPEITYTAKDDKTWLFAANDFSEGELSLQQFCLRFKTKEIALDFKNAIENAKQGKPIITKETYKNETDSDDVVFVSEIQATEEEKQKAKQLMLPENFFTYKSKDPCKGCRGCKDDSKIDVTPNPSASALSTIASVPEASTNVYTPVKTTASTLQSPMNSFYGTPANFDKTADATIFRTPLGSLGSNTNSASPATPTTTTLENNTTNKENMFAQKNIFGSSTQTNLFGTPSSTPASIFAAAESQSFASSKSSILAAPKLSTLNTSGNENQSPEPKSIFGIDTSKSIFNENNSIFANANTGFSANKPIFGLESDKKDEDPKSIYGGSDLTKPDTKSIFVGDVSKSNTTSSASSVFSGDGAKSSLFGSTASGNIFQAAGNEQKTGAGLFQSAAAKFGVNSAPQQGFTSIFGSGGQQPSWAFGAAAEQKPDVTKTEPPKEDKKDTPKLETEPAVKDTLFKVDQSLSFAALSSTGGATGFHSQKKPDFQWEGAGQQLFTSAQRAAAKEKDKSKNDSGADESAAGAEEEYDPHYEPIVPLPDKIVVSTGEEDEEKLFGERAKLYRYDEKSREWKERGVGEIKILHHPERKTYRLLLRREQVHKAVLNMLILMDLELLPMKNSDRAWTWAGRNFAENAQGEQETLALRFKSVDLAAGFKNKLVECTSKLQALAAQALNEEKKPEKPEKVAPLRLPKHLESSARADTELSARVQENTQTAPDNPFSFGQVTSSQDSANGLQNRTNDVFKQVHFQEQQEDDGGDEQGEDEEHEYYDHNEDYDAYYNEEEEESAAYYECLGEVEVRTDGAGQPASQCPHAHVQVLFDQDIYSPKIVVTDNDTGEILADMLIHTDTEFQMSGDSCTWSGQDYTSNDPVDKTVTVHFPDSDTAMQFYDSCETSKGATYSSTDPET